MGAPDFRLDVLVVLGVGVLFLVPERVLGEVGGQELLEEGLLGSHAYSSAWPGLTVAAKVYRANAMEAKVPLELGWNPRQNTAGSRYSPCTATIAARISPRVQ